MAKIKKPNSAKTRKGAPPMLEEPSQNLTKAASNDLKPLNFKVSTQLKKEFKQYALDHEITMVELFARAFEAYKK